MAKFTVSYKIPADKHNAEAVEDTLTFIADDAAHAEQRMRTMLKVCPGFGPYRAKQAIITVHA